LRCALRGERGLLGSEVVALEIQRDDKWRHLIS
jgi:hypothetical protein